MIFPQLYLSDIIFGGIDGIITSSSIISGVYSLGMSQNNKTIIVLGLANLISGGFSGGYSRYICSQTEVEQGLVKEKNSRKSAMYAGASYIFFGSLLFVPFMYYKGIEAFKISFAILMSSLFFIGYVKAIVLKKEDRIKCGARYMITGVLVSLLSFKISRHIMETNIIK